MRRFIITFLVVVVLISVAFAFVSKVIRIPGFNFNTRNVVSLITPPSKDIRQSLPQGANLTYPLAIPDGKGIGIFADLKGMAPRVLTFDSNQTLLVSLTSQGKILAMPDANNDGQADKIVEVLTGLNKPHGLAFDGNNLYVAETNKVSKYTYDPRDFSATNPQVLFELPAGGRHFTRTIRINSGKLYVSIGSSCDTCVESNELRASIWVANLDGSDLRPFATGLRNTVFFTFDRAGNMWGTDMGRDYLGDSLPPDEINIIEEGKDYGWPYCYGKQVRDAKFRPGEFSDYCPATTPTAYDLDAHVAPLGLAFDAAGDLYVALHGSWNSTIPAGYKIVKLSVFANNVTNLQNYVSGWLSGREVLGRPVDIVFDDSGRMFVSDDKAGLVYILSDQR